MASQPVASRASLAGHQSASVEDSAPVTSCSPDSVSSVTIGLASRAGSYHLGLSLTARRRPRQYRARCLAPSPTRSVAADRPVSSSARRQGLLALVIVIVAWGLTWPVNKVVLATLSPLWAVTLRSAIATVALFALTAWRGRVTLPPAARPPGAAEHHAAPHGRASICSRAGAWAWCPPAAPWCSPTPRRSGSRRARRSSCASPSPRGARVGVLIGLAGLVTLFNPLALDWSDRDVVLGNLAILAGALLWALSILHIRAHRWVSTPFALIPWETLLATALLVPFALATTAPAPARWTPSFVTLLLYLGIVGTAIAYWATATASRHLPAVTTSLGLLATPVVSVITATALARRAADPLARHRDRAGAGRRGHRQQRPHGDLTGRRAPLHSLPVADYHDDSRRPRPDEARAPGRARGEPRRGARPRALDGPAPGSRTAATRTAGTAGRSWPTSRRSSGATRG